MTNHSGIFLAAYVLFMVYGEYTGVIAKIIFKSMNYLSILLLGFTVLVSCKNEVTPEKKAIDSLTEKTVRLSIDQSFEPVIKEQLKVFSVAYPDVNIIAQYKPEAACLRDLQEDSTKIVIVSRGLSREETTFYNSKIGFKPEYAQMAKDAIAVIINNETKDSTFTLSELKNILLSNTNDIKVVVDGNSATSTVRYLKDSLLKGGNFGSNVSGAKNSEDLVKYIAETKDVIGIVGVSWLTNPQNSQQEELIKKVKFAMIECNLNCDKGVYAKPSQQTITFNQYPLVRGLYYILKENYAGMGSRLIHFLSTERGQLIFRRASLVPVKINFDRRRTQIKIDK